MSELEERLAEAGCREEAFRTRLALTVERRQGDYHTEEWATRVSELEKRFAEAGRREEAFRASITLAEERQGDSPRCA